MKMFGVALFSGLLSYFSVYWSRVPSELLYLALRVSQQEEKEFPVSFLLKLPYNLGQICLRLGVLFCKTGIKQQRSKLICRRYIDVCRCTQMYVSYHVDHQTHRHSQLEMSINISLSLYFGLKMTSLFQSGELLYTRSSLISFYSSIYYVSSMC